MRIHGICPPVLTPFNNDGVINDELLRVELRHLVSSAGVHGVVLGGSTGEGHTLSTAEIAHITGIAAEEVGERVPVIAGVISNSTRDAIEKGTAAANAGAAALQVTSVGYLFRPNDDSTLQYFADVADATGLPIIIYNVIPWNYMDPQLLTRIVDSVEGVIGVKQSAMDLKMVVDLVAAIGDRALVMSATDALLYPSFVLGAHGSIGGINSAVPGLSVKLWDAVQESDHAEALRIHRLLHAIWNNLEPREYNNMPACTKYAASLQGRDCGIARAPMHPPSSQQCAAIEQAIAAAGLIQP